MPIPDEKARAWTRPQDYWPPRRPRRSAGDAVQRYRPPPSDQRRGETRPLLELVPYAALMIGLAVLAIAIMVLAWPGRSVTANQRQEKPVTVEVGTAPKGWIDQR
jgi:hypothetical protein